MAVENGADKPWWINLVQTIGPTAAIAIFLVYFLAMDLSPVLKNMNDFMIKHAAQMDMLITTEKADSEERKTQWITIGQEASDRESALQLEQQTCINTARSDYQSKQCLEIRNRLEARRHGYQ